MHDRIHVEVACVVPDRVFLRQLELPEGATVGDAIDASGLRSAWPQLSIDDAHVGIYSRRVRLDTILRDGDRIEIYRPLKVDPKEARRKRAAGT